MPQKTSPKRALRPPQRQRRQPGLETRMTPRPQADRPLTRGTGKLRGKVALITGGDSGIGRAVAIAFAKEGADVGLVYLNEHGDARETVRLVEQCGVRALRIAGDVGRRALLSRGGARDDPAARSLEHPGQQCRRAAPEAESARHHGGAARAHLPDEHLLILLHDQSGAPTSSTRRRDHQHQFGHGIPREPAFDRLRGDEGGDRRVHAFPLAGARRARHSRQRRGARPDLDAL